MRRIAAAAGIGVLALGLAAAPALAHHGWSSYDASRTVVVEGTVSKVRWGNPHVMIWLEQDGQQLELVLAPPSRMENRGLPQADLAEGAKVSLDAYRNRGTPTELRAERIRIGGKTVELR